MKATTLEKLETITNSAKYDVSCASSGCARPGIKGSTGNTAAWGICHSFADDGRCISLLKTMLTNNCIYDCAYCLNRKSNDIKRVTFSAEELSELTIEFYKRNYIEGLFLSSGVIRNPDYTMGEMVKVLRLLRNVHKFNGYIHMKAIPGANNQLIQDAGLLADRLSVNIEISSEENLKFLAPDKSYSSIFNPMKAIGTGILENKEDQRKYFKVPKFAPAGQSTQLIIGATPDTDKQILNLSSVLYNQHKLKRVYYSGFIPVNDYDKRLPAITEPPLIRENRLYQADWLLRFYEFSVSDIVNEAHPNLDLEIDPKLSFALRNPWLYPVDINKADYEMILKVPGIGVKSAKMIVASRRFGKLNSLQLAKIGVVMKRAKYFITCNELTSGVNELNPSYLKTLFTEQVVKNKRVNKRMDTQLKLF